MTFTQLKYFQTICKYNNITRASAELHISQPSLSNAVRELEHEFGVSLFNRRSRGLELTPEGHYFLTEAGKILDQAEQLSEHMKQLGGAKRTLTLGLPAMSGSLVFADLLQALYARSPGIHVQVIESGSLSNRQKVLDGTLDAAIITRNSPLPSGYGHIALRQVDICLYISASHRLAAKETLNIKDLDHLPLALLPEESSLPLPEELLLFFSLPVLLHLEQLLPLTLLPRTELFHLLPVKEVPQNPVPENLVSLLLLLSVPVSVFLLQSLFSDFPAF